MPTLNWIGKEALVNHHQQVPFHLLKDVPELACGEPGDGNLIVQGDNLDPSDETTSHSTRRQSRQVAGYPGGRRKESHELCKLQ